MKTNFSELTHAVLTAYGLSEKQLAEQLGVSQPTVHRMKSGEIKSPAFHTGARLVELYDNMPRPAA